MIRTRKVAAALVTAVLAAVTVNVMTATAAQAAVWKIGERIGTPHFIDWPGAVPITSSYSGEERCDFASDSTGAVKLYGDWIYVRDDCADGRSAVAMTIIQAGAREGDRFVCRNTEGNNTWVRCNFEWPENIGLALVPGVYNGSTGYLSWDHGNTVWFRNNA